METAVLEHRPTYHPIDGMAVDFGLPAIRAKFDGPLIVHALRTFLDVEGITILTKSIMHLCRCGNSSTMPFCDFSHQRIGFTSSKSPDRKPDNHIDHVGKNITIHDNRAVCDGNGTCHRALPQVFRIGEEPWIFPDSAGPEEIARVIRLCPTGAFLYTLVGQERWMGSNRPPAIIIIRDGPYCVVGNVELYDDEEREDPHPHILETPEHYSLCRCGRSKNKPLCDASHSELRR